MDKKQRHLGRELALQWLFQIDMARQKPEMVLEEVPDEMEEWFEQTITTQEEALEFARKLVNGVIQERRQIDEVICRFAKGWSIDRMAGVERNVLRLAIYEIHEVPDIPISVTANEAVEVTKRYGAEESAKFVNGILGSFIRSLEIPEGEEKTGE